MLDSSAIIEAPARSRRVPELDAEAPGPHILEMETRARVSEVESQRRIGELEG